MKGKTEKTNSERRERSRWEGSIVVSRVEGKDGVRMIDMVQNFEDENTIAFRSQVCAAVEKLVCSQLAYLSGRAVKSTFDVGFTLNLVVTDRDRMNESGKG